MLKAARITRLAYIEQFFSTAETQTSWISLGVCYYLFFFWRITLFHFVSEGQKFWLVFFFAGTKPFVVLHLFALAMQLKQEITRQVYNLFQDLWNWFLVQKCVQKMFKKLMALPNLLPNLWKQNRSNLAWFLYLSEGRQFIVQDKQWISKYHTSLSYKWLNQSQCKMVWILNVVWNTDKKSIFWENINIWLFSSES